MSIPNHIDKFLQPLFPDWQNRAFFAQANFPKKLWVQTRNPRDLKSSNDCYVSIAAFYPACTERTREQAIEVVFLVIDDVGPRGKVPEAAVEKALGPPTRATQTSKGNQHWFYALSALIPKAEWRAFALGVEKKIGPENIAGKKIDSITDPVHVYRLPMGRNTKPENNGFVVHEVAARNNPSVVLDISTIERVGPAQHSGSQGKDAGRYRYIGRIVALVPNIFGYNHWIDTLHRIWSLAKDKEDGREAFIEFTARWSAGVPGDASAKWDTIRENEVTTAGLELLREAETANKVEYDKIMQDEAKAALDDNPEPPPEGGGGSSGTTHVDMAEDIIRRERGLMGWMSNAPGHWAAFDPVMGCWVVEHHDALMRAAVRDETHKARMTADKGAKAMGEAKWRNSVQGLLVRDRRLMLPFDAFDAGLEVFGIPGGIVALTAAGAVEMPGSAGQMVSKAMTVRPAPKGTQGIVWERFLTDFTCGDKELRSWWQVFMGYCLTGKINEHAVVFVWGPGGNGKGVFLDTIAAVMGPYHRTAPNALFMESVGHKHMASVADLVGARLVTTPDVTSRASWDLGLVKSLSGGGKFKAQFMRENWFEFTPQFKIVLPGQDKPDFGGVVDKSIRRRFWMVPAMNEPMTDNKSLGDVLRTELPAVLRWMIDGWEMYNMFGGFPSCSVIERETKAYLTDMDTFGKFKETLVKTPEDMTRHRMTDLWDLWEQFRNNEKDWKAAPIKVQDLSTKLREAGYNVDRDNKGGYIDQITIAKSTSNVF